MSEFTIPEHLESERLILRPFVEADWRSMHAHYSHPDCTRYTLGRVLSEGESWRLTATLAGPGCCAASVPMRWQTRPAAR